MVNNISAIITKNTNPYRNLAIEEHLTLDAKRGECVLFLWQNEKSVVIGKNQNAYAECDTERLEAEGGHLVRRLSGGGAVFHDLFLDRKQIDDVHAKSAAVSGYKGRQFLHLFSGPLTCIRIGMEVDSLDEHPPLCHHPGGHRRVDPTGKQAHPLAVGAQRKTSEALDLILIYICLSVTYVYEESAVGIVDIYLENLAAL